MYGIPNMKLDKQVVFRRIELMQSVGIKFVLNTEIGRDISAQELVDEYDAVVLCGGTGKARQLEVEGSQLQGVHLALDYLKDSTRRLLGDEEPARGFISAKDKQVIVLGGGDTGTDCVATAIRDGCRSIRQFEIQPQPPDRRIKSANPWPEWPRKHKLDYGQAEAFSVFGSDPRHYLLATTKIDGNPQGEVEAVHTVGVNWFKNSSGILAPVAIRGTEKVWPADLVLLALGFVGPDDTLPKGLDLNRDGRGNVQAEFGIFETNRDKVFAAGDIRRGQSLVVWAIQEGKLAAREVDKYLTGQSLIK